MWRSIAILLLLAGPVAAEPVALRIVAANLTSGRYQSYSPDNGNHSNLEGAGARILKGLQPDVVLIQEFQSTVPLRQWVNATFGKEFSFYVEDDAEIPNGVISRYPIVASGEWDDPVLENRDFAWAKIALPNGRFLWAISVHFYSRKSSGRQEQAEALLEKIRPGIPEEDLVVLGGDFNTRSAQEACLVKLTADFDVMEALPADRNGNANTNANRNKPYDRVLADSDLTACDVPLEIGGKKFEAGLVFDSRVFEPLEAVAPAQAGDSGVEGMQHMAVVRDFLIP